MKYRPDVDGLRAVAVVSVILNHAASHFFPGGFVGVDIFFVISGFVITTQMRGQLNDDRFSLISFYERRVRRIVPALACVLAACMLAGTLVLLPIELRTLGTHTIATAFFVLNKLLSLQSAELSGYFTRAAETQPLLHLWSLSVEEQFYLGFPCALWLLDRYARRYTSTLLSLIAVGSFLWSIYLLSSFPESNYYVSSGRAWELLVGCLLALGLVPSSDRRQLNEAISAIGAALIIWAMWVPSFQSQRLLAACLGAGCLIWSGGATWIGAGLAHRWAVVVGLGSYSLYLWHWPALAFPRYWLNRPLTLTETTIAILLAAMAAAASWQFVEQPVRRRRFPVTRAGAFRLAVGALGGLVAVGAIVRVADGLPGRWPPASVQYAVGTLDRNQSRPQCTGPGPTGIVGGDKCALGPEGAPAFVLWGDSHANAIMPAFGALAGTYGIPGVFVTHAGCPGLLGLTQVGAAADCVAFNESVVSMVKAQGIRDVVLVSRWNFYLGDIRFLETVPSLLVLGGDRADTVDDNTPLLAAALAQTIDQIRAAGARLWIVQQVPALNFNPPRTLAFEAARNGGDVSGVGVARVEYEAQRARAAFVFAGGAATGPVIDLATKLCGLNAVCRAGAEGRSLYFDDNHLSAFGALWIADSFKPVFDAIRDRPK